MNGYYDKRAAEYDDIYKTDDPVRQGELDAVAARLVQCMSGRRVLEIACGTGHWTAVMALMARSIVAIDVAPQTLEVARARALPESVELRMGDAYALGAIEGSFDAVVANFFVSHVPRVRLTEFLDGVHRRVGPGGTVFLMDNVFVEGRGGELVARADEPDTYKRRTLNDGSVHEVLKNYFAPDELRAVPPAGAPRMALHVGQCYWWLDYVIG